METQGNQNHRDIALPKLTLGTWDIRTRHQADVAVSAAISAGYRGIDSAACYENERVIRDAVEKCGIHRGEVFLTSKLWNNAHGYDQALRAFDRSEKELGSIDMYLIHWPGPVSSFLDTWKAFERLLEEKRVGLIGVSNFMMPQLDILLANANIRPMVNQIECHLWYVDRLLLDYCRRRNILVQGYSPLAAGSGLLTDPVLLAVAARLNRTPAQVALRRKRNPFRRQTRASH